jgi:hypothetical protein
MRAIFHILQFLHFFKLSVKTIKQRKKAKQEIKILLVKFIPPKYQNSKFHIIVQPVDT